MALGACAAISVAGLVVGANATDALDVGGSDSAEATTVVAERSPDRQGISARIVFWTQDLDITTDVPRTSVSEALEEIRDLPDVDAVDDPFDLGLISPEGHAAIADVRLRAGVEPSADTVEAIIGPTRSLTAVGAAVGGPLIEAADDPDAGSESWGLVVALVVLTIVLGSLAAATFPLAAALVALSAGFGLVALMSRLVDIPSLAAPLALTIGAGVGIDDGLLLVARYREERRDGSTHRSAVEISRAQSGRSVLTAGLTTIVSIMGLTVCGIGVLTAMGLATAVVVAVTVAVNVTLLPAAIGLWGRRIRPGGRSPSRALAAWSGWAMRHRTAAVIIGVAVLGALAAPALDLTLAYNDAANAPPGSGQRLAYDRITEHFGEGHNADLVAVIDLRRVQAERRGDTASALATAIGSVPGVARVLPADFGSGAEIAAIRWFPDGAPASAATEVVIDEVREGSTAPEVESVDLHVGGTTAMRVDFTRRVADRLWLFVTTVIALSLVVLTVAFRAPVVALKAAALNLASVAAAYGVVVMVFEWGWGASLIGAPETQSIDPFVPVFLFAILFGLSIDYEVFLIDRIRENYRATGDNDAAISGAVAATGGVIGSAALIMVAVFAGFIVGDDLIKIFGVGLTAGILIDVTIVRTFLLPATMSLLGDANWWRPRRRSAAEPSRSDDHQRRHRVER